MKLQAPKRILNEDFAEDDKAVAGQLGGILNTFNEELYLLSSKNMSITDNFNQEIKSITLTVGATGVPSTDISFKNNLKGKVQGMQIIRTFSNVSVTAAPFIEFSESSGIITIGKVIGLVQDEEYQLVILIIGN